MSFGKFKKVFSLTIFLVLISIFYFSSYGENELTPSETIKKYRIILETEKDPAKIAESHYEIGLALEELGKNTEATAEYLKIIVNYPEVTEINKKAEERLSELYSSFSEKKREIVGTKKDVEAQKDPTIFFAYIKSLYENHRNLGQYDKAINILKNLYDMDPENSSYLIDMGELYLHGYNNIDSAITHFNKALNLNPDNPRAYVGLGLSYEKKDDYENAVTMYAKASEVAPASPWAIYGLRRIEGIRFAEDKTLVKDWYFLGPFDNSERDGLEKEFPPEKSINLKETYIGKDRKKIRWFRPFNYDVSGYVDLNTLFKPNDYAVAYALTYVHSLRDRDVDFRIGAEDGIKIWVNDDNVADFQTTRSSVVDSDVVKVKLKRGWNKVLLKVSDTWGSWGFYFRVTDLRGNPIDDVVFDPLEDNTRLNMSTENLN